MMEENTTTWVIEIDPLIAELRPELVGTTMALEPGKATIIPGRIRALTGVSEAQIIQGDGRE